MTPRCENEPTSSSSSSSNQCNSSADSKSKYLSEWMLGTSSSNSPYFLTKQGVLTFTLAVFIVVAFVSYSKINLKFGKDQHKILDSKVENNGLQEVDDLGKDASPKRWRKLKKVFGNMRDKFKRRKRRNKGAVDDQSCSEEGNMDDEMLRRKAYSMNTSESTTILSRVEKLDDIQMNILAQTRKAAKDVEESAKLVPWGGPGLSSPYLSWWNDELFASYLIIMKFPQNLKTNYPFTPCAGGTCSTDFGIRHTAEFRMKYKPWIVTPKLIDEAESGVMYSRGLSFTKSGIVWYRPGLHQTKSAITYTRLIINTLERAVVNSLLGSEGKVGKYYTFLDCEGFKLSSIPGFNDVKKTVRIMQDHMPDRLEKIYIFNLSTPARMFMNMITSLLSEEVRKKIITVPNNYDERLELLRTVMDNKYIPTKFGGEDDFVYNAHAYLGRADTSDENGEEYLKTMPYHA